MTQLTRIACILVIVACMLAAIEMFFGRIEAAIATLTVCIIMMAGMTALNLPRS